MSTTYSCWKKDTEEYRSLLNDLTINVTEFFRDPDVYQALRDKVLPEILEHKRAKRSNAIRIWSAGCATGEEPYSLAMLVHEYLSKQKDSDIWMARITATDLDENSLQTDPAAITRRQRASRGLDSIATLRRRETRVAGSQ